MVKVVHGNEAGSVKSNVKNASNTAPVVEISSKEALNILGSFIEAMTTLGSFSGGFRGFSANPLALTGGAILLLPWLSSIISNGGHFTPQQALKVPPQPSSLADRLNHAESQVADAKTNLATTRAGVQSEIESAASKLGLNVSGSKSRSVTRDQKILKAQLTKVSAELKKNPEDIRLKIKSQILQNAINNGLSYREAHAQIYEISKKFDNLDTCLQEAKIDVQTYHPKGFSKLFSWFKKAPAQTDPSKARLQESLGSLEASLNQLGIYDLDRVLSQPLSTAKKSV
jgi:hypothetical protein